MKSSGLSRSQASLVLKVGLGQTVWAPANFPRLASQDLERNLEVGGLPRGRDVRAVSCTWHLSEGPGRGKSYAACEGFPSCDAELPPAPPMLPARPLGTQCTVHTFLCARSIASLPHPVLTGHPSKPSSSPVSRHPRALSSPTQRWTFSQGLLGQQEPRPSHPPSNPLVLVVAVVPGKVLNDDLFSLRGTFFPRWARGWLPGLFYLFAQMSLCQPAHSI